MGKIVPRNTSTLETSLRALADDLAQKLLDAVLRGSLDELGGFSVGHATARPPSGPAASAKARAPRTGSKKSSASRSAAADLSRASRGEALEGLVTYLRARPEGARAEELRAALGLPRSAFIQATRDGLSTEEIRKVGQLRATTYFAM